MHKHFSFKGPLTSLISSNFYCNLGIEAFSGGLSSDGTEFCAPCDRVGPPNWGVWSAADTALPFSISIDEHVPLKFLMTKHFIMINHRYI